MYHSMILCLCFVHSSCFQTMMRSHKEHALGICSVLIIWCLFPLETVAEETPTEISCGCPTRSNQVKFPNSFSTQWLSDVWLSPWKMSSNRGGQSKILISVVERCWSYNHQQVLIKTIPNRWWFNMSWFPMIPHHLLVNKPTYILSH